MTAAGFASVPLAASAADIFYSGRATGINGQTTITGTNQEVLVADVGMSCQGLPHDETVASFSNPAPLKVSVQNIKVHTLGKSGASAADASMQNLNYSVPGLTITSSSIGAHARATCDIASGTVTATGHSDFQTLVINGQATTVSPNKRVDIPNVGRVVLDEHRHYSDQMKVNAIHITLDNPSLPASGEVYIGQVRAQAICNP
jgi:hypothetical protein